MSLLQQLTIGAPRIEANQIEFDQLDQIIPLLRQQTQLKAITLSHRGFSLARRATPAHSPMVRQLLDAMEELPQLRSIRLGPSMLGHPGSRSLSNLLAHLTYLDLSQNQLRRCGWRNLIDAIPVGTDIGSHLTLILVSCDLMEEDLLYLAGAMLGLSRRNRCRKVRRLRISTGVPSFPNTPVGIRSLDLSHNNINEVSWIFDLILKYNTRLQSLVLGCCRVHLELPSLQHNTSLQRLKLDRLNRESSQTICRNLLLNSSLTELKLARVQIGSNEARTLGQWLSHNSSLTRLRIDSDELRNEEFKVLLEGLESNQTLLDLNLKGCRIEDPEPMPAWSILERLHCLNLSKNQIGMPLFKHLIELLAHNSPLTSLKLSESRLESNLYPTFGSALQTNTTLRILVLSSGSKLEAFLDLVLDHNSTLERLDLRYWHRGRIVLTTPKKSWRAERLEQNRGNRFNRATTLFQILLQLYYDAL